MNDCIFKHDPPRQDCSQCMNLPKPSATSKPVEGYFKATLDYAPKTNGKKFAKWCEDHGFTPLNGGRRAWSGSLQTYLRSADGVAYIDGEPFLFDEDDLVDLDKQVLEGRIHEVVMFTSVDTIAGIPVPSCSTCEGIYDYSRQRLIELEALEGSGIPPAQNKDALQTNNKEKK